MPTAYDELPDVEPASPYDALPSANPYDDLPAATPAERIDSDPFYAPSREEFKAWRDTRGQAPSKSAGQLFEAGTDALGHVAGKAVDVLRYSPELVLDRAPLSRAIGTLVEAGTRGTFDLGRTTRDVIDKFSGAFTDEAPEEFKARYRGAIAKQFAGQDAGQALQPQASASLGGGRFKQSAPPLPSEKELDRLYADYKLDRDYDRFLVNRALDEVRTEAAQGKRQLAQSFNVGTPAPNLTEPLSTFVGLEDIATMGAGALAEQAARAAAREMAGGSARAAGRGLSAVGDAATVVGKIPERAAAAGARAIGAGEETAETVRKAVSGGQGLATVAPGIGFSVPGVTEIATAATGAKVGGKALQSAGEAAQAVGRVLSDGPSRVGALERISKDGAAPLWLRKAAATAAVADPALKAIAGTTGAAARGAAGGAAVGGGLGFVLSGGDPEAAAAGLGGGIGQGALGGLVNRVRTRTARNTAEADADLARWMGGKSADEVNNLAGLRLSREQALKVADVERWARGVLGEDGGDITFRYVTDSDFRKQFGSSQRGAQIIQGERPAVIINTGYRGPRSLFHETMHAIDGLDAFDAQRTDLNRRLFTESTPDGQVLSKGLFDAADLAAFEQSYRARLGPDARTEWDAQPATERASRIRSEVRAESFANYVSGASGRELLNAAGGWRRRLADSVLLADNAATLGKFRRVLEAAGVEFKASGEPSDLFFKNGQPATNSPEVDATLRDYLRAKRRLTDRLVAGDDDHPATVFDEHAIRAQPKLAQALAASHPEWDGWAKNKDGSVKFIARQPVLATTREMRRLELNRGRAMVAALKAVPDVGAPDFVKENENGSWDGTRFGEAQLRALEALPDDVLAPSIKARLRQMNDLAGGRGGQIVIDYNAALDKGRYSSSISPATRIAVPLKFRITKAGNFLIDTLDVTHFIRKLGQWQTAKPRAFDAWGGDVNAFTADVFKYLDNHQRGLNGHIDLDADAAVAINKRNVIQDLFNIAGADKLAESGHRAISGAGGKDRLIRGRRVDRINRITPGEGTPFPIDYYRQKANFDPRPDGHGIIYESEPSPYGSRYLYASVEGRPFVIRIADHENSRQVKGGDWRRGESALRKATGQEHHDTITVLAKNPGDVSPADALQIAREAIARDRAEYENPAEIGEMENAPVKFWQWKQSASESGSSRTIPESLKTAGNQIQTEPRMVTGGGNPKQPSPPVKPQFLPATHPGEVMQVVRDQSGIELARTLGLPPNTGRLLANHYFKQAAAHTRPAAEAAARSLRAMTPSEQQQLQQLIMSGGLNAARAHLTRRAREVKRADARTRRELSILPGLVIP